MFIWRRKKVEAEIEPLNAGHKRSETEGLLLSSQNSFNGGNDEENLETQAVLKDVLVTTSLVI